MKNLFIPAVGLFLLTFHASAQGNGNGNGNAGGVNNAWKLDGNSGTTSTNFLGTTDNQNLIFKTNSNEALRVDPNGNIGIGISTPMATLDLNGTFKYSNGSQQSGYFLSTDADGNASWAAVPTTPNYWTQNGSNLFYNGGFVGIGTSTPGSSTPNSILEVFGRTTINGADPTQTRLTFSQNGIGATQLYWNENTDFFNIQASRAGGGGIKFIVRDQNQSYHDVMTMATNANIGIGTNSPNAKLHLNGNLRIEDGTEGDGYVLTSDANGNASWLDMSINQIGTQANPYSELYATDFIKVGTSSLWLGSTLTPGTADLGEFIFTTGTNQPLRINGDEGPNTGNIQNTHINPDGGLVGIGTNAPRHTLHSTGNFLIEGDYKSLLFGETPDLAVISPTPNKGQFGIEYEPTERGLNFWKPFGSKKVDQATNGFKNFILFLNDDGVVGINLTNPTDQLVTRNTDGYKLNVNGGIRATRVKVQLENDWADYVFEDEYELMPLEKVEQFIQANGHLPNIPSAEVIEKEGIELGEMNTKFMEKIEELTLYMIELKKENEKLKEEVNRIKNR